MEINNTNIFLYVFTGSLVGAGLAHVLIELVLRHFLSRLLYSFKLTVADKRVCAKEILEIISTENESELGVIGSRVFIKAQSIYDRLEVLNQDKINKVFWNFVTSCVEFNPLLYQLRNPEAEMDTKKLLNDFNEGFTAKISNRNKLLKAVAELKR